MFIFQRSALAIAAEAPGGPQRLGRRTFLKYAGAVGSASALGLAGCSKDNSAPGTTDVGSGDNGTLNLAYALKQVEVAFYSGVLAGSYFQSLATTSADYQILSDIARHVRLHADFLRTVLASRALRALTVSLDTKVSFTEAILATSTGKLGVLNAAQTLADLTVAAVNGTAGFLTTADYLTLLGKMVSVEARHAALLRDVLLARGVTTLPEVIDSTTRREKTQTASEVVATLNTYLAADSQLTATRLQ